MNKTPFQMSDYLDIARKKISNALIDAGTYDRIQQCVGAFSGHLSSYWGLETLLSSDSTAADFLLSVNKQDHRENLLSFREDDRGMPPYLANHVIGERIARLAKRWFDGNDALAAIDNLWLEFDIPADSETQPLPSLFFGLKPAMDQEARIEHINITKEALGVLMPMFYQMGLTDCQYRVFDALPEKAFVFQVGAMLPRETAAVRYCIQGIPPGQICPFLETLGWRNASNKFKEMIHVIGGLVDRVALAIDVDDSVQDKVGLECYVNHDVNYAKKLADFMDYLSSNGQCVLAKREAIEQYGSVITEHKKDEVWPAPLKTVSAFMGPNIVSSIIQYLNHIKIDWVGDRFYRSKAYLAVRHHYLDIFAMGGNRAPKQS